MAKNAAPHKRQHSQTLARTGIKKPTRSSRIAESRTGSLPAKKSLKLPPTKHEVDENRQGRAKHAHRSQFISRFQPHRLSMAGVGQAASVALPLRAKHPSIEKKPAKPRSSKANDVLMEGLARANSHNQPQVEIKKRYNGFKKVIGWSALVVAIILVAGFFLYKVPAVNLGMVSFRAGVDVSTPSYRPGGFTLSTPIHYSQGSVKLIYHSSQKMGFYLSETKSDWDSTSLRDEFVSPSAGNFQTVQTDGLSIYTYGSGQATWVSGGIWYQLGGNANLNQDQITKIAASL